MLVIFGFKFLFKTEEPCRGVTFSMGQSMDYLGDRFLTMLFM